MENIYLCNIHKSWNDKVYPVNMGQRQSSAIDVVPANKILAPSKVQGVHWELIFVMYPLIFI